MAAGLVGMHVMGEAICEICHRRFHHLPGSTPQTCSRRCRDEKFERDEAERAVSAATEKRSRLRLRWRMARARVMMRRARSEIREAKEAYRRGR